LFSEQKTRVNEIRGARRLLSGQSVRHESVDAVEVGVHHKRRATAQIHEFLPPVAHVIGGPPRLEPKVALELAADAVAELLGQTGGARQRRVVEEGAHGLEVARDGLVERGQREARQRRLIGVQRRRLVGRQRADQQKPDFGGRRGLCAREGSEVMR
jgi:hypothetical protein